ncbi:hypothetical protein QA601_14140 [Chitinispirillales bacterium ANBcel5]|uniref:hypothetical protein n=1 Tax=Cellulosispirillum alkaliphilum TaxID=3039283 RepID=UPI002A561A04|nr:hypothetical protein [Chitinispirillales bacterium ANBcel5]
MNIKHIWSTYLLLINSVWLSCNAQPTNPNGEHLVENSPIHYIYQRRYELLELFDEPIFEKQSNPPDLVDFIKENITTPFDNWIEQSRAVEAKFTRSIRRLRATEGNQYSGITNNDIYVQIYASFLSQHSFSNNYARRLLRFTSYDIIRENAEVIFHHLKRSRVNDVPKSELLALTGATIPEIRDLLDNERLELPLHVKARVGDKEAEKALIEKYSQETEDFRKKRDLVYKLLFAGTDNTIRHVVSNFNEPIFSVTSSGCVSRSIRYEILIALRVYHPTEELIGEKLRAVQLSRDPEILNPYLEKVERWLESTYDVTLQHERPGILLTGMCKIY